MPAVVNESMVETKEAAMKRLFVLSAAVLSVGYLIMDDASAQRRSGAGVRMGTGAVAYGGASVRISRFRGAAAQGVSLGARSTVTHRPRIAHRGSTAGHRGGGLGDRGAGTPGVGIRAAGIRSGFAHVGVLRPELSIARHAGWRHHHRWRRPVAAVGIGFGYDYAGYPAFGDCLAWDGTSWVNVCYEY